MLTPQQIVILKKTAFVAECLQKFNALDFSEYAFRINTLVDQHEVFSYTFKVSGIDCEYYTPELNPPGETNLVFGREVDVKVIYYITYLFKEIFGNEAIGVYISHAWRPFERPKQIVIGSYITKKYGATNLSRFIMPSEIIQLNIDHLSQEDFLETFSSVHYDQHGFNSLLGGTINRQEAEDDNEYEDYEDNGYYEDYSESDYYMPDEPYMSGDPRYDRDENPWIDVFGPGDEAETAYWNTD